MRQSVVRLCLAVPALMMAVAALGQASLDTTSPRIAVNQEATDTPTRLELLQQELYSQQQDVMFLTLLRQYDDRMLIRRSLFPSGQELAPACTCSCSAIPPSAATCRAHLRVSRQVSAAPSRNSKRACWRGDCGPTLPGDHDWALALIIGNEAMVVCKDVLQLDDSDARKAISAIEQFLSSPRTRDPQST